MPALSNAAGRRQDPGASDAAGWLWHPVAHGIIATTTQMGIRIMPAFVVESWQSFPRRIRAGQARLSSVCRLATSFADRMCTESRKCVQACAKLAQPESLCREHLLWVLLLRRRLGLHRYPLCPASTWCDRPKSTCSRNNGGGGIRTPGTLSGTPVFKTGPFNHSGTPPGCQPAVYRVSIAVQAHRHPRAGRPIVGRCPCRRYNSYNPSGSNCRNAGRR